MLQKSFSKIINIKTEKLGVSLLKLSAEYPVVQVNEVIYDSNWLNFWLLIWKM